MYSSCKRSIPRNTTWSARYISLKRNIPRFDIVLLHSNWSSLRRKYLRKIPTDVNALSCGSKTLKFSGISDAISPRATSAKILAACTRVCRRRWRALTVSVPDYGSWQYTCSLQETVSSNSENTNNSDCQHVRG